MNSKLFIKRYQSRATLLAMVILLPFAVPAAEQTAAGAMDKMTANEKQIIQLIKEVNDAQADSRQAPKEKSDEPWARYRQLNDTNLPRVFALASQDPASSLAAAAFQWIVTNARIDGLNLHSNGLQSLEFLRDYHATDPGLAKTCRFIGMRWDALDQPAMEFLQRVAKENPDREVRGQASLALARILKNKAQWLSDWEDNPVSNNKHREFLEDGEKNGGSKAAILEARKLCQVVLDQYADCPSLQATNTWHVAKTLGDVAKNELFELEHLMVGETAPELEGEDLNGHPLKLSDYRGKVIMLSFWASWCGPCMQLAPSEVNLAKRMEGKPFVIIGINGDIDRSAAMRAMKQKQMTWPSFGDEKGPYGVIPTAWNISVWPTVILLDTNRVVRLHFEGYGGTNTEDLLVRKIDALIR